MDEQAVVARAATARLLADVDSRAFALPTDDAVRHRVAQDGPGRRLVRVQKCERLARIDEAAHASAEDLRIEQRRPFRGSLRSMRAPSVLLALPLLAVAAVAGRASDASRATPRAAPGAASLLGGFTAIAVQVLWLRADQAVTEFREDDAQLAFAAISELEPQLVSGGDAVARWLGYNLAEDHKEPAVRWALGREGWRVLCRTVELNPGVARAFEARAMYALNRLARDPPMRAGFVKDVDPAGPLEHARRDFEEALRLRPQWREPWDGVGIASIGCAGDAFERGDFADAATLFRRAHDAFHHVVGLLAKEIDPAIVGNREAVADNAALASALVDVCAAPPEARAARLADVKSRFGAAGIPELPKR